MSDLYHVDPQKGDSRKGYETASEVSSQAMEVKCTRELEFMFFSAGTMR